MLIRIKEQLVIPNCMVENNVLLYRFNQNIFKHRHNSIPLIKQYIKNLLSFRNFEALKNLFQVFKEDKLTIHEMLKTCFKFHFSNYSPLYNKNILLLSELIKNLRVVGVFKSSFFYDYNFAILDIVKPREIFNKEIVENIDEELFVHYILTKISESVFFDTFYVFYQNVDHCINQECFLRLVNDEYELKSKFNKFLRENQDKVDYFLNKINNQDTFNIYQTKIKKSIANLIKNEENKPYDEQTKKEFYLFLDKFFDLLNNYFSKRIPT